MHFSNVVQSLKLQIPRRLHEIDSILFVNYGDIHSFDLGFIHIHPSPEWHRTYHVFRVKKNGNFHFVCTRGNLHLTCGQIRNVTKRSRTERASDRTWHYVVHATRCLTRYLLCCHLQMVRCFLNKHKSPKIIRFTAFWLNYQHLWTHQQRSFDAKYTSSIC